MTLERAETPVPETLTFGADRVRPYRGGEAVSWRLV